jgi:transcriptional regulator with XRE-family HTH domain
VKYPNQNVDLTGSDLPARLIRLREQHHISKSDLAEKSGLSYRTIHDLELGKRTRVQEKTLLMLAAALAVSQEELLGRPPDRQAVPKPMPIARRWWLPAAVGLLAIAAGFWIHDLSLHRSVVENVDGAVVVRDGIFKTRLWSLGGASYRAAGQEAPWSREVLLIRREGKSPAGKALLAVEKCSGDTLWTGLPDETVFEQAFGPGSLAGGNLFPRRIYPADLDGDGRQEVLARFSHSAGQRCILAWFSRSGQLLGQYCHLGRLEEVQVLDLDADGKDEVVAAGMSLDPDNPGAVAVILDDTHFAGAAVAPRKGGETPVPDGSLARVILPDFPPAYLQRLEVGHLQGQKIQVYHGPNGKARVRVELAAGRVPVAMVDLDRWLRPLDAHLTGAFQASLPDLYPDSLIQGTGPGDPTWLAGWLGGSKRFGGE